MTKQIEAVYEEGILRPLEPLQLPEGARLNIILMTRDEERPQQSPSQILAEIAVLPEEAAAGNFSGRDHDSILYPEKPAA